MSKLNFMKTMRVPTGPFNKDNKIPKNQKDSVWNNRFHLDKIPSYNAFNDTNSKIYQVKLRSILKSLNSKPSKKSFSPAKASSNIEDLLKMDNRTITNKFYKDMNRDINKEISEKIYEPISEEMNIIQSMWDDLGVLENYRVIFRYICLELDPTARKGFLDFEQQSLKKIYDFFSKLTKEIQGRERVISLLRQYNNFLENDNISPKLTSDITQTFKNLRILSINIVHIFIQIREISSYSILCGKFDFDRLNKNFNYDRNYLIKMRTDTDFLKQSNLSKYFNIVGNVSDPFLLSLSQEQPNSNKLTVPLTDEMLNSVRKCQLLILQDQLYYEMNLSMMNQYNNLDFSERSVSGHKIQNLKENSKKRGHDKKIQSATIPVFERQHDEFTIKSNIESVKNDQTNINNIKVQARINSAKKQTNDDGIEKNLNDSKIKKTPNQKIEKLDIKIKEKLDKDAKEQRDKDILNIIDIDDNIIDKLIETKENENVEDKKTEFRDNNRIVSGIKKKHQDKINNSERNINVDGKSSEKILQQIENQINFSKQHNTQNEENLSNNTKENNRILTEKETPKHTEGNSTKNKENSVKDMYKKEASKEIVEDKVEDEIDENYKNNEKGKVYEKKIEKVNKLGDSNMIEVIDENSILDNNRINDSDFLREEKNRNLKEQENITSNNPKVKEDFEINDIYDEESFQSEKEIKDDIQYLRRKSHSRMNSGFLNRSMRERNKNDTNHEKIVINTNNSKENDKLEKLNPEPLITNLNNDDGKEINNIQKDKSNTKIEKVLKTEESKKQQTIISDTKLSAIKENHETAIEAKSKKDTTKSVNIVPGKNEKIEENFKTKPSEESLKANLKPLSQKEIIELEKKEDNLIAAKLDSKTKISEIKLNKESSIVIKNGEINNKERIENTYVLTEEKVKEEMKIPEENKPSDDQMKEEAVNGENTGNLLMDNAMIISNDTKFEHIIERTIDDKKDQTNINDDKILADINDELPTQNNIVDYQISEISNVDKKVENSDKEKDDKDNQQEANKKEKLETVINNNSTEKKNDEALLLESNNKENLIVESKANQVKISENNIIQVNNVNNDDNNNKNKAEELNLNGNIITEQNVKEVIIEEGKLEAINIKVNNNTESNKVLPPVVGTITDEVKVSEKSNVEILSKQDNNKEELKEIEVIGSVEIAENGKIKEENKNVVITPNIEDNNIGIEEKKDENKPVSNTENNTVISKKEDKKKNNDNDEIILKETNINKEKTENIEKILLDKKSSKEIENTQQKFLSKKENPIVEKENRINEKENSVDKIIINETNLPKINEIQKIDGKSGIKIENSEKSDLFINEKQTVDNDKDIENLNEKKVEENLVQSITEIPKLIEAFKTGDEIKDETPINLLINEKKLVETNENNFDKMDTNINNNLVINQTLNVNKEEIQTVKNLNVNNDDEEIIRLKVKEDTQLTQEVNVQQENKEIQIKSNENKDSNTVEIKETNKNETIVEPTVENNDQIKLKVSSETNKSLSKIIEKNEMNSPKNKEIPTQNVKEEENPTKERSETKLVKVSDLNIKFYTNSFEELQTIYDLYYSKIPEDQLISFKVKKDLRSYILGNNMKIITIHHQNNLSGLCILNFDSNTNNMVRIILSHFSTILENFNETLTEVKNFIFRELKFSEIVVNLYYKKLGEKFEIISVIRDAFKDLLKFRWLKIENTCGERLLVMGLKNEEKNPSYKEIPDFNFALKYNIAYELLQDDGSKPLHQNENERFLNPLPLIISFANLGVDKGYDVDYDFLKNINNTALHRHYPHFMRVQTEEKKSLINSMKQYINEGNYEHYKDNAMITNTLVYLAVQFNSVISSRIQLDQNPYYYNRINLEKLEVYTNAEHNLKFYNIPFTDDRHSLFIGEVPEEIVRGMKLNILTEFFMLKSKLVQSTEENVNIWIPCFDFNSNRNYNKLHYLDEVKISHSNVNYSVFNSSDLSEISMKSHSDLQLNCKINPDTQRDIIIKDNFLFAIINIDLATELNLPAIFVEYVKKAQWK